MAEATECSRFLDTTLVRLSLTAFSSTGNADPYFPPPTPPIPCLPELRANCFFKPPGCFPPKFLVSVSMATKNPAALYFLGILDGVGVWDDGKQTRFLLAGTFLPYSFLPLVPRPSPKGLIQPCSTEARQPIWMGCWVVAPLGSLVVPHQFEEAPLFGQRAKVK